MHASAHHNYKSLFQYICSTVPTLSFLLIPSARCHSLRRHTRCIQSHSPQKEAAQRVVVHAVFLSMTDRSGVKQPVGQKFLTNVAVVRYRAKGQEYQVPPPHSRCPPLALHASARIFTWQHLPSINTLTPGCMLQKQVELVEVRNRNRPRRSSPGMLPTP